MKLYVSPAKTNGELCVPGSKSHTIRAVVIATLAKGKSVIKAPLVSEDTLSCLKAASTFGAWVKRGAGDAFWEITGTGGRLLTPAKTVDMGNSGTGTRLFTALAALGDSPVFFDGDESLRTRPMAPLLDALRSLGAKASSTDGKCPCSVQGPIIGGEAFVNGKSSQFVSALLMAAPLAKINTILLVQDPNETPYIEMTLDWLKQTGIQVTHDSRYMHFALKGGQSYTPFERKIPGDFSTACFPLVAAAVTGGKIHLHNLDFKDSQGDKAIFDYLKKMGASISVSRHGVTTVKGEPLKAVELDLNATPDALPIMAVAAACATGTSVFRNVAQARIKETDRIACMATELRKMGIKVEEFEDGMAVTGGKLQASKELESYKDHRIVMALAIAALAVKNQSAVSIINDAEAAAVTYPGFVNDFRKLGARFQLN